MEMIGKFKCLGCGHYWEGSPEPDPCPKCNHDYVKWLNYEEMRKEWNKDGFVC